MEEMLLKYENQIKKYFIAAIIYALIYLLKVSVNQEWILIHDVYFVLILSFLLIKFKLRSLSIILGLHIILTSLYALFKSIFLVSTNIDYITFIFSIYFLVFSIKGIHASFKRASLLKIKINWKNFFIKSFWGFCLISIIYFPLTLSAIYFYDFFNEFLFCFIFYMLTFAVFYFSYTGKIKWLEKYKIHNYLNQKGE